MLPELGVGVGERTLRVTAEHADIWNIPGPPFLSAELIDAGVQQVILALQPPVRPAQWVADEVIEPLRAAVPTG